MGHPLWHPGFGARDRRALAQRDVLGHLAKVSAAHAGLRSLPHVKIERGVAAQIATRDSERGPFCFGRGWKKRVTDDQAKGHIARALNKSIDSPTGDDLAVAQREPWRHVRLE